MYITFVTFIETKTLHKKPRKKLDLSKLGGCSVIMPKQFKILRKK